MSKASSIPQPSILLVEDHPGERQELEEHLHDVFPEARVESAESSEKAIQEFRKQPFDVLVIDIKLKKDTMPLGLDVVRKLKLLSDHPFRSVAYSGYPKDYRFEAGKVGFDAFVEKPRIDELIDAIHDLFELLVEHPSVPIGDVFCSMPFDKKALDVYLFGIKDAAQAAGFICRRNDEKTFTTDIVEEIKKGGFRIKCC